MILQNLDNSPRLKKNFNCEENSVENKKKYDTQSKQLEGDSVYFENKSPVRLKKSQFDFELKSNNKLSEDLISNNTKQKMNVVEINQISKTNKENENEMEENKNEIRNIKEELENNKKMKVREEELKLKLIE